MVVVVVPADPPRPGLVLPGLAAESPLTDAEAADLYAAMLRDVAVAAERSGGELLVNYRSDDLLPDAHRTDETAEAAVRAAVRPVLAEPSAARFEPQVGSTESAQMGNTVTHLLEREEAVTVVVLEPTAPLVPRTAIDSMAMKLRRHEVVLGPATGGRVYAAGFADTVDFTDAFEPPALETLTDRALSAGREVDFAPLGVLVGTAGDLPTLVSLLRTRSRAGRIVPEHTLAAVESLDLQSTVG